MTPSHENFQIKSLMNLWEDSNFPLAWGSKGRYKSFLYQAAERDVQLILI